jgi:hypothetical protein
MDKKASRKSWTIMVYMAGDNNLDPEAVKDLKEMKRVGSTAEVNVIAQLDRDVGHATKRYYLRKGGTIAADAVASLGKINTGDPRFLLDFVRWGVRSYRAERYLLVLWNHGQGWDDTDIYADERFRGFRRLASGRICHALFRTSVRRTLSLATRDPETRAILLDDNAKDFLDNLEMKKVAAATAKLLKRKLDILGMDACLMSMAEVGYQLRDSVAFSVGSEETEPGEGWPYHTILAGLAGKPSMSSAELGGLIVKTYLASYSRAAVTQSACDLSAADTLAGAVGRLADGLTRALTDPVMRSRLVAARMQAQSYEVPDNIDLFDFCALLAQTAAGSDLAEPCRDVMRAVQAQYVVAHGYRGSDMKNSHGVAIYFPDLRVSPLYAGLDFSRKTGWDAFLKAYVAAVRGR